MPVADLQRRVEMLQNTVESLRKLPADVRRLSRRMGRAESQILQFRTEIHDEFSAIRREMATKADLAAGLSAIRAEMATKTDLAAGLDAVRAEMATKAELAALRTELRVEIQESVAGAVRELSSAIAETRDDLARSIRDQLAEAQRQTRMLFEDVVDRLKILGERNPHPLRGN